MSRGSDHTGSFGPAVPLADGSGMGGTKGIAELVGDALTDAGF
jgi:hypothetical protein